MKIGDNNKNYASRDKVYYYLLDKVVDLGLRDRGRRVDLAIDNRYKPLL